MSTKYYALPKLSEQEKQDIITMIHKEQIVKAKSALERGILIGLGIAKAQFVFYHNDWKYFDKSLSSLKNFIENSYIANEYGEQISHKVFWDRVYLFKDGPVYGDEICFGLVFSKHTL